MTVTAQPPVRTAPAPSMPDIADPSALGLAGFAMTTFVLSWANAGLVDGGATAAVALALAYGGLAQLLAGMWEFRKGNTFGALAFSSYGAFWISFWFFLSYAPNTAGLDIYLLAWTIFTTYMLIASLKTNGVVVGVFFFLALTYLFLTIGAFGSDDAMTKVGGWLGLVTAVIAWYGSFAVVTNATWKRTILPTWPL